MRCLPGRPSLWRVPSQVPGCVVGWWGPWWVYWEAMIECVGPRPSPSVGLLPSVGGRCPGFGISKLQVGQDQCCGTEVG